MKQETLTNNVNEDIFTSITLSKHVKLTNNITIILVYDNDYDEPNVYLEIEINNIEKCKINRTLINKYIMSISESIENIDDLNNYYEEFIKPNIFIQYTDENHCHIMYSHLDKENSHIYIVKEDTDINVLYTITYRCGENMTVYKYEGEIDSRDGVFCLTEIYNNIVATYLFDTDKDLIDIEFEEKIITRKNED